MRVQLFTKADLTKLVSNGDVSRAAIEKDGNTPDHVPVTKLFTPAGGCTWLLTEYDAESGRFFGLCDLGLGFPELGYVSREEIEEVAFSRNPQVIERDRYFKGMHPLSVYAQAAREHGHIVESTSALVSAAVQS
jgi:hypothetical protein